MMKILAALENLAILTDEEVETLTFNKLCTEERTLTGLAERLLNNEVEAAKELNNIIRANFPPCEEINPLPYYKSKRVFGPENPCGDMAAFSMDY